MTRGELTGSYPTASYDVLVESNLRCPYQPLNITFPALEMKTGKRNSTGTKCIPVTKRYFKLQWYSSYPWLYWRISVNRIFCFYCLKAKKHELF